MRRLLIAAVSAATACAGSSVPFRPPAVPLAVVTPFFSLWSFAAEAPAGGDTAFWHGEPSRLTALARVDGKVYTLLGAAGAGAPAAAVAGLPAVGCTRTRYAYAAGGVSLTLTLATAALPAWSLEAATAPAALVQLAAASADGGAHAVQLFFSADGAPVAGAVGRDMEWDRPPLPAGVLALRQGQVGQRARAFNYTRALLNSTEPFQRQDYGFVYLMDASGGAGGAVTSVIAAQSAAAAAFAAQGSLPGPSGDAAPPAPLAAEDPISAALSWDLGTLDGGGASAAATAVLLVDEVVSVLVHGRPLAPYWRRAYPVADGGTVPAAALSAIVANASAALAAAAAFDAMMAAALEAAGGAHYAAAAQLVYRQTFGGNGYAWNGSAMWAFQKEISSDGDLSTLDVIFPSAPQALAVADGVLLRALLEPELFEMAGFDPALHYTQPCALHSLGKWPVVDAGNGGCSMPMESTGDALLLAAAYTQAAGGDASSLAPYMPLLRTFADYCSSSLPWPAFQDFTDDFSHAPGNLTNLALKCVLAQGAEAYLEQAAGNTSGAAARYAAAAAAGAFFAQHAWAGDHFQFIYNLSWADSYGLMYNAAWARLLGLEGLIPGFTDRFHAHYEFLAGVTANATWCTPLSSMEHDSKWDWLVYTAALDYTNGTGVPAPSAWSSRVFDQLFYFANTTSSRFPLSDHPSCIGTAPPAAAADRARPVLGAFFAPLLIAQPTEAVRGQWRAIRAASAGWWQD